MNMRAYTQCILYTYRVESYDTKLAQKNLRITKIRDSRKMMQYNSMKSLYDVYC